MASQFLARPFAALRPTAESAADVIAPPYDVVSTDEARALAANRPASFLHISRPEIDLPPGSSPYFDAAYQRGAEISRAYARAACSCATVSRRSTSIGWS
jgi:uncharacterized protein (DUF1015 family)